MKDLISELHDVFAGGLKTFSGNDAFLKKEYLKPYSIMWFIIIQKLQGDYIQNPKGFPPIRERTLEHLSQDVTAGNRLSGDRANGRTANPSRVPFPC